MIAFILFTKTFSCSFNKYLVLSRWRYKDSACRWLENSDGKGFRDWNSPTHIPSGISFTPIGEDDNDCLLVSELERKLTEGSSLYSCKCSFEWELKRMQVYRCSTWEYLLWLYKHHKIVSLWTKDIRKQKFTRTSLETSSDEVCFNFTIFLKFKQISIMRKSYF